MKFTRRPRQADTEARILPLINVVFLLLIFFMLAGRLTEAAPFAVLPPTSAAAGTVPPAAGQPRVAVVLLAADGRLALNGEPLAAAALTQALAGPLAAAPGLPVHLKADGEAEAAAVVAVMAALRDAGVRRLQLFTLPAAGQEGQP